MRNIELREMTTEQIYTKLKPQIKEIYTRYLEVIDSKTFGEKVYAIINEEKEINNKDLGKTVLTNIERELNAETNKVFSNPDSAYKYIVKLSENIKFDDNISYFNYINNLLEGNENMIGIEVFEKLFNNCSTFNDQVSHFVNNNMTSVQSGSINQIYDNVFLLQAVDIYCKKHNINQDITLEINDEEINNLESVRLYLNEIGNKALLSPEEEYNLGLEILKGNEAARNELVERNLKLVVSIARLYKWSGMDIMDLISEGNLGLMKAAGKFDATKGFRFSTYATWWIKQTIRRSIADQGRTIRLPVHMKERLDKYYRTKEDYKKRYGQEPTPKELANALEVTIDKIYEYEKYLLDPISLQAPVGEEGDTELESFVSSNERAVEDEATQSLLKDIIESIMEEGLTEREKHVLIRRFGLDGNDIATLEELGKEYGITRERIRQIEKKALNKLRNPKYKKVLTEFDDDNITNNNAKTKPSENKKQYEKSPIHKAISKRSLMEQKLGDLYGSEYFNNIMEKFTRTEAIILILYYGHIDNISMTIPEIAKFMYTTEDNIIITLNRIRNLYVDNIRLFVNNLEKGKNVKSN